MQIELREKDKKQLSYATLCKILTGWRHDPQTAWLAAAPTHPLQQALKDLEKAYTNFLSKRAQYPRFKKKGRRESFRYPDPKQIKRFVAIQTEREVEVPTPEGEAIGIDMGIARFATMPDGTHIEPLNSFRRHEAALSKAQKAMSRKEKFSNNWKKAIAKIQRIHARIRNVRNDYLHKQSTKISKTHAIVCVEKLQVGNMSRSAAGTAETPGKNVRAKSGLNKSILDQGWYEFRRQLEYKLAWNGGWLELVPPPNTSRTCPACSHVSAENRQTQAEFRCVQCGFEGNADVVGATNILRAGLARLVCQANEITRRQQEPTEALLAQ
jgi:putative transposase